MTGPSTQENAAAAWAPDARDPAAADPTTGEAAAADTTTGNPATAAPAAAAGAAPAPPRVGVGPVGVGLPADGSLAATSEVFPAVVEAEPVTGEFPKVEAIAVEAPTNTTETLSVPGAITDELPKMPPEPVLVAARLREIAEHPLLAGRLLRMSGPDGSPQVLYVDDRGGAALLSGLAEATLAEVDRSVLEHAEAVRLLDHLAKLHRGLEDELRRAVSAACAKTPPPRPAASPAKP